MDLIQGSLLKKFDYSHKYTKWGWHCFVLGLCFLAWQGAEGSDFGGVRQEQPLGFGVLDKKEKIGMGCLGNLLWLVFGGLLMGLSWVLAGLLWCITIIGIPVGLQCFKFAGLCFFPFGKDVRYGGGVGSLLLNIIWILVSGIPLAVEAALIGCLFCITIIGIPFGLQCFKIAKLALMPFGSEVIG